MKRMFIENTMTKTNIEFLSDLTRTYTTFIVGAGAMAYYASEILIKSVGYILTAGILYLFGWIIIMIWARENILKEETQ